MYVGTCIRVYVFVEGIYIVCTCKIKTKERKRPDARSHVLQIRQRGRSVKIAAIYITLHPA